ncbi:hypothetical protein [Rhizorhabdus argentea]|uniref:hypothetical protein n=1 Tax=Rhizorhabdus argentea TaxID=1387174 RepID=UPI0030EB96ED
MKKSVAALVLATIALAGCQREAVVDAERDTRQGGRYFGIGIYSANGLWEHLVRQEPPNAGQKNPKAATLGDDSEIIVVVDSRTGEVRQCGNFSGYCISTNPWKGQAGSLPATLAKHASDIEKESEAQAKAAYPGPS